MSDAGKVDLFKRGESLPVLFGFLRQGIEPPITNRSFVVAERYLRGWRGLLLGNPPWLTMEGGVLLLRAWYEDAVIEEVLGEVMKW